MKYLFVVLILIFNSAQAQWSIIASNQCVSSVDVVKSDSFVAANAVPPAIANPGSTGFNGIQIASLDGNSYYSNIGVAEITILPQALSTSDRQHLEDNQQIYYSSLLSNRFLNISTAAVAYSVRQLRSSYYGKALQVRRSSDNATQDIGFTAYGDLDTAALKTFVGSGNGYVTIWYDQSGNGRNATQTTTSQQPAIVLNGVVQRANTQPAVVFDGISQTMASAAFGTIAQGFTRNSVIKIISNKTNVHFLNSTLGSPNTALYTDETNPTRVGMYAGSNYPLTTYQTVSAGSTNIFTEQFNGSNAVLYDNGTGTNVFNVGNQGVNGVQIGSVNGSLAFANIAVSEVILVPSLLNASNRQNIESNQNLYYTVYTPPSNNLILNTTPASVAYSVRLINSNYVGKALQVRRSSDNTTQDIGFTTNGDLDTTALKNFVGSGNGYVTIWYDQSGNGRNATQTNASQQPTIILNGVVQRGYNAPIIVFNGTSQTMASAAFSISQPFTRNSVIQFLSNNTNVHYLNNAGGSPNTGLVQFGINGAGTVTMYAGNYASGPSQTFDSAYQYVLTEEFNGDSSLLAKRKIKYALTNQVLSKSSAATVFSLNPNVIGFINKASNQLLSKQDFQTANTFIQIVYATQSGGVYTPFTSSANACSGGSTSYSNNTFLNAHLAGSYSVNTYLSTDATQLSSGAWYYYKPTNSAFQTTADANGYYYISQIVGCN
jgi:hypothetical protein